MRLTGGIAIRAGTRDTWSSACDAAARVNVVTEKKQ
jgi:hypothetical protein